MECNLSAVLAMAAPPRHSVVQGMNSIDLDKEHVWDENTKKREMNVVFVGQTEA